MRRFLWILLCFIGLTGRAAEWSPSSSILPYSGAWTPGAAGGVGVPDGIPTRTTLVDITSSPHNAPSGVEKSVSSLTQSSGTATLVTSTAHGISGSGHRVLIYGATPSAYNGFKTVSVVNSTTLTFTIDSGTSSPASGTIKYRRDATGAIASAISAATAGAGAAGEVVYIPNDEFVVESINPKSNISIRGAAGHKIWAYGNTAVAASLGTSWRDQGDLLATATGGLTKGSSVIEVSSTTGFTVGRQINLQMENDTTIPVMHVTSREFVKSPITFVSAIGTGNITVSNPLLADYSGLTVYIRQSPGASDGAYGTREGIGIENLNIDWIGGSRYCAIFFPGNIRNSWIVGCTVANHDNYGIYLEGVANCTVRTNTVAQSISGGSNHAGILVNTVRSSLIEDNIVYGNQPATEENFSSHGNVWFANTTDRDSGGFHVNVNHGPGNQFNIYEQNIVPGLISDGYFSGAENIWSYKNWITGKNNVADPTDTPSVNYKRFSRNFVHVGNIQLSVGTAVVGDGVDLGDPPGAVGVTPYSIINDNPPDDWDSTTGQPRRWYGTVTEVVNNPIFKITLDESADITKFQNHIALNPRFSIQYDVPVVNGYGALGGYAALEVSAFNAGTRVVTFVSDGNGQFPDLNDSMYLSPSEYGFSGKDEDVEGTITMFANHSNGVGGGLDAAVPGGATLPVSMIYPTRPDWWDPSIPYPAITGLDPTTANYAAIPSARRYLFAIPPVVAAAAVSPDGTKVIVTTNKIVDVSDATGFTISLAGGQTLTYLTGTGTANLEFSAPETITNVSAMTLSYVTVTNGIEDENGNDLPSVTNFPVANRSTVTPGGAEWHGMEESSANTTKTYGSSGSIEIQPIVVSASGLATHVRLFVTSKNSLTPSLKCSVQDSSNNVLASTGAIGVGVSAGEWNVYQLIPSINVTAGATYKLSYISNENGSPTIKILSGQTNAAQYSTGSYSTFPPDPLTPEGNTNDRMAFQMLVYAATPEYTAPRTRVLLR